MKQCPRCLQLFANEMLKFCRLDGSQLVSAATPLEEADTIRLDKGSPVVGRTLRPFTMRKELKRSSRET
jgi:hypothetical protein